MGELFVEEGTIPGDDALHLSGADGTIWHPSGRWASTIVRLCGGQCILDAENNFEPVTFIQFSKDAPDHYPVTKIDNDHWEVTFDKVFSLGHEVGFSPDGRFCVIMNNLRENNCSVFNSSDLDPRNWKKIAHIEDPLWRGRYPSPFHMVFSMDGKKLYRSILHPSPARSGIMVYGHHERGFALASMRSPTLSRYYIQCDLAAKLEDWPDERFWAELKARFPKNIADQIVTGASIEKSIAPLRSFVTEPMCYGRLFLVGDTAHIVPPTGAKGLNLAVSDAFYLARGMVDAVKHGRTRYIDSYSDMALHRVWGAERLSWWMTTLLHHFPGDTPFDERMRENQLDYLARSDVAQASLAEQYVGLPFED